MMKVGQLVRFRRRLVHLMADMELRPDDVGVILEKPAPHAYGSRYYQYSVQFFTKKQPITLWSDYLTKVKP